MSGRARTGQSHDRHHPPPIDQYSRPDRLLSPQTPITFAQPVTLEKPGKRSTPPPSTHQHQPDPDQAGAL